MDAALLRRNCITFLRDFIVISPLMTERVFELLNK